MEIKTSKSGWGAFLVSGLVAIIYGLLALLLPKDIIKTVMIVSGIILIVTGLICFIISLRRMKMKLSWGMLFTEALAMVALGVVAIVWSKETAKLLIFVIGLWSVIIGSLMLGSIFRLNFISNRGFYITSAILSILFGVLLMINPFESGEFFVALTGVLALAFGIIMMMFGFMLRKAENGIRAELMN